MSDRFPPENYIQVPSAVPGIEVFAPRTDEPVKPATVVDFSCPQCGAATAYSLEDGGLKCAHCGYYEPPQVDLVGKGAQEFEFAVTTLSEAARGWGELRSDLVCENCGAVTSIPADSLSAACPFCSSNKVFQRNAFQDVLRPRFLIPFKLAAVDCVQIAREWLGSSWMTPPALKQEAGLGAFTPVYLPYWTFDSTAGAQWEAEVGYDETEQYYNAGSEKWESRTVTRWRHERGNVSQVFDDVLVSGTGKLSALHLSKISNFNLGALVAYSPEYLAGIHAQSFDTPLETAWEHGRGIMREATRAACMKQIRGDHVRNFQMSLDFANESWRYLLAPVLVNAFRFQGSTFRVLINGQTGSISGQRPVDWTRIWLAIAACLAPGGLTALAGVVLLLLGPVGPVVSIIGFTLLLLGLAGAFMIYRQAEAMDDY